MRISETVETINPIIPFTHAKDNIEKVRGFPHPPRAKQARSALHPPKGGAVRGPGAQPPAKPGRPYAARRQKARRPYCRLAYIHSRTHPAPNRRIAPCAPQKGVQSGAQGNCPWGGPIAAWRTCFAALTPRQAGTQRPAPPKGGAVRSPGEQPPAKPGRPYAARRQKARRPYCRLAYMLCCPHPAPSGRAAPCAPKRGRSPGPRGIAPSKAGPPVCGPAAKSQAALLPPGVHAFLYPSRTKQAHSALRPQKGRSPGSRGTAPGQPLMAGRLAAATLWPTRRLFSSGRLTCIFRLGYSARNTSCALPRTRSPPSPLVTRPMSSTWLIS